MKTSEPSLNEDLHQLNTHLEESQNQQEFIRFLKFCLPLAESGASVQEIWDTWNRENRT